MPKRLKVLNYNYDLLIKSNIFEITLKNTGEFGALENIQGLIDRRGDFLAVTRGLNEITLVASDKYEKEIRKILSGYKIIKIINNLSALVISLPNDNQDIP